MSSYKFLDENGFKTFWSECKKYIKRQMPSHLSDLYDDLNLLTEDTYHKDLGIRLNYRGEVDTVDDLPDKTETDIGDIYRLKEGCDYKAVPPNGLVIRMEYEWRAFADIGSKPISRIPESTIDQIMSKA